MSELPNNVEEVKSIRIVIEIAEPHGRPGAIGASEPRRALHSAGGSGVAMRGQHAARGLAQWAWR